MIFARFVLDGSLTDIAINPDDVSSLIAIERTLSGNKKTMILLSNSFTYTIDKPIDYVYGRLQEAYYARLEARRFREG